MGITAYMEMCIVDDITSFISLLIPVSVQLGQFRENIICYGQNEYTNNYGVKVVWQALWPKLRHLKKL